MTKLRLIKPWGLRMVRQHANVMVLDARVISSAIQCCTGPVGAHEDVFRGLSHEIRTVRGIVDAHVAHRRVAPVVCGSQLSPANTVR